MSTARDANELQQVPFFLQEDADGQLLLLRCPSAQHWDTAAELGSALFALSK